MNVIDRVRIWHAVQRYDMWLELRGVRHRDRKVLRTELRTNLRDAAADIGTTRALFGIGSPRELAYAVTDVDPGRPRWYLGLLWAGLTFAATLSAVVWTSLVFLEGVLASGVTGREVHGSVFPWVGARFTARNDAGAGLSFGVENPWQVVAVPLVVFLLVAQPWRLLRRASAGAGRSRAPV